MCAVCLSSYGPGMGDTSATKASRRDSDTWPRWLLLAALLAGNMALALGPWFVRLADTGPVAAGFWRLFLAIPFLFLFARANGERPAAIPRGVLWPVLLAGFAFALDIASWHIGIERTRLGNSVLFGNSGSIVLMIWGFVVARTLPQKREWLAVLAALTGAAILLARSLELSSASLVGDLLCLLAGLFYAVYLLLLQNARRALGSWSLLFWVCLSGAPVLLLLAVIMGEAVIPQNWWPVIALFVSSQLVGQGLLVFSLKHFPALVIGLALLTQPAIAAFYGFAVFGETLSALDIAGMLLLGGALVIARTRMPKAASARR